MRKLKMETTNLTQTNIEKIAALFPNVITEMKDENGKFKKGINFELLKQELSGDIVDGEESFDFTWVGKRASTVKANTPIRKTLRPHMEESKDWENTENLYIEGDNLDVLKLLQESYLNSIKMIYIDPPYNTGNDFIYKDNFTIDKDEYNEQINLYDEDDNRLFKNTETNGRFHSDWCSMMYPRIKLAKDLLSDDGVIFMSIGDEEVANLRKICDEIFGEANFRNQIIVRRGAKSVQAQFETWDKLGQGLEYILLYTKNANYRFPRQMKPLKEEREGTWNNHWRGTDRPTMRFTLFGITPENGQWRWGKERSEDAIENYSRMLKDLGENEDSIRPEQIDKWISYQTEDIDLLRLSRNGQPEHYISPTNTTLLSSSWIDLLVGSSSEITRLFGTKVFDTAKLTSVIIRMLNFVDKNAVVLDFFSGSATTAHAVMQLNAEDGGNRKFIMVQLPEPTDQKSEAYKAGYKNIAEIGKERIRRAGEKIKAEIEQENTQLKIGEEPKRAPDIGFRVLKLDSTNMKDVYYAATEYTQSVLEDLESNIKEDRTDLDLLYGVMLDWGLPLSLKHEIEEIEGVSIHTVDEGSLIACFAEKVSENVVREIAKRQPLRVVFRDSSFANSPDKINVEEIFRLLAPNTTVKVI